MIGAVIFALFLLASSVAQVNLSVAAPPCYGARVSTNNDLSATSLTVAGATSFALDVVLFAVQEVDGKGNVVNSCIPPCYQNVLSSSVTDASNDTLSLFSIPVPSCNVTANFTVYSTNDVASLAAALSTSVQANEIVVQVAVTGWSFAATGNSLQALLWLDFYGVPVTGSDVNQTSPGFASMVSLVDSGVFVDSFVFPLAVGTSSITVVTPASSLSFNGTMITIGAPPNVANVVFQAGVLTYLIPPVPEYQNYTAAYVLTGIAGGIVLLSLTLALIGLVIHLKFGNDAK